jgi:hypothetical protein
LCSVSHSLAAWFSWSLLPAPEERENGDMKSTGGQVIRP